MSCWVSRQARAEDLEALTDHMRKLTEEFDRRAAAQWASAS
jgi:hypothetical protein